MKQVRIADSSTFFINVENCHHKVTMH